MNIQHKLKYMNIYLSIIEVQQIYVNDLYAFYKIDESLK